MRRLKREDCEVSTAEREKVDLLRQDDVEKWMANVRPDAIFMAAAKVGGIHANTALPANFIYQNLVIETNIIHSAYLVGVEKLMFLGSSCIYPKMAQQPMAEGALLTGPLEPTNEWYAIAKIAGVKLCHAYRKQYGCDFISAMPTNLYGPGDNYDLASSHVAGALMVKMHQARARGEKEIEIWGTGTPKRKFLHVDDLADGLVFLMKNYSEEGHINVGSGQEISICDLADVIANVVGYRGKFNFNVSMPDGTPRKLMDNSRIEKLGWRASTSLEKGMTATYEWYLKNAA